MIPSYVLLVQLFFILSSAILLCWTLLLTFHYLFRVEFLVPSCILVISVCILCGELDPLWEFFLIHYVFYFPVPRFALVCNCFVSSYVCRFSSCRHCFSLSGKSEFLVQALVVAVDRYLFSSRGIVEVLLVWVPFQSEFRA